MADHLFEPGATCIYEFDCQFVSENTGEKCKATLKFKDQQTEYPKGIAGARKSVRKYGWGMINGRWHCHAHKKQNRFLDIYIGVK